MRIFLTGATGLLGINTIESALAHGHSVMALARDPKKAARVLPADERITVVPGDLENADAWIPRLKEADALIHGAAYFREYFVRGEHEDKLRKYNVELPVRLAKAADAAGMRKIVMVSSSLVVPPAPDNRPSDETIAPRCILSDNAYGQSKVQMEAALAEIRPQLKGALIIVRPGWMFGPNDYAPTSAGQLVRDILEKGGIQMVGGKPLGIADARDVAEGMILALEKVETSQIYNLAGNVMVAIDALREVARKAGKGSVQQVPMPMAMLLSVILEPITRWRGVPNPIPRDGLLTLSEGVNVSSEKARRELGVTFRPFPETAQDTVTFFRERYRSEK